MTHKKRSKMGRPPLSKSERKDRVTPIRFQDQERTTYEKSANLAGMTLSEWVRRTLNAAVKG